MTMNPFEKSDSFFKIGGVPPLAERGYDMRLRINFYIIAQKNVFSKNGAVVYK